MGGVGSAMGMGKTKPKVPFQSFYEYSAQDSSGKVVNFSDLKGKVVLVVNVASK